MWLSFVPTSVNDAAMFTVPAVGTRGDAAVVVGQRHEDRVVTGARIRVRRRGGAVSCRLGDRGVGALGVAPVDRRGVRVVRSYVGERATDIDRVGQRHLSRWRGERR